MEADRQTDAFPFSHLVQITHLTHLSRNARTQVQANCLSTVFSEQHKLFLPCQYNISHITLTHKTLPQNSVLFFPVLSNPFTKRLISSSPSHCTHLCSYPHPENNFLPQKPSHNKSNRGLLPTFKLYQLHYLPQILHSFFFSFFLFVFFFFFFFCITVENFLQCCGTS